jgi:adenosine deaminase
MEADDASLRALPKAELHVHLDGSLRPATMLELARERGIDLPAGTANALGEHMVVRDAASLEEYLERFALTLSVMQDAEALRRITHELVLDHAAENVRWVEIRFCPQLNTREGLGPDEVLDATLRGMREAVAEVRAGGGWIDSAIIVCGLRSHPSQMTSEAADLAVAYAPRGVCGFDLAGAEAGHPVADHRDAVDRARAAGLPITLHAGEGFGPGSIRQALDVGHATRIGHGTRLHEDPTLLSEVRDRQIPLEMCLTSNVQTGVVPSLEAHPAHRYLLAGVPVSLSTDNRLMSGVTLTDEYRHARDALGMTWDEIVTVARTGFEHAFAADDLRTQMLVAFEAEVGRLE